MAVDRDELRRIMGHFATGVAVVTTLDAERRPAGMTANSLTSLSIEPPLLLVCVDKAADCYACFGEGAAFAINLLTAEQEALSRRFASKGADKFQGVGYREGESGCAILDDGLGYAECRIVERHDGGDHTIVIGEVIAGDAEDVAPLLFYRGGYRSLAAAS